MADYSRKFVSGTNCKGEVKEKWAQNGYTYTRRMSRAGVSYWYCVKRDICKASLIERNKKFSPGKQFWKNGHHATHEPDASEVAVALIKGDLKKRAIASPLKSTGDIYSEVTENQPIVIQSKLPSESSMKQMIKRTKFHPDKFKDPLILPDLMIPDHLKYTARKELFLQHDSEDHLRTLVFATSRNIELLSKCKLWIVDGTFKTCPKIYKQGQVYSIHGFFQHANDASKKCTLPLVYAILPRKTEATYTNLLSTLKNIAEKQKVILIISYIYVNSIQFHPHFLQS